MTGLPFSRLDAELIENFELCLLAYDKQVPFTRNGQYSFHRKTIDQRRNAGDVLAAIESDLFLEDMYETLKAWGIGKRASRIVSRSQFGSNIRNCANQLEAFEKFKIADNNLDVSRLTTELWKLMRSLHVVENVSLIVPGTKAVHHLLPDLVPPMDRAWTGAFFNWSATTFEYENRAFDKSFEWFLKVANQVDCRSYVGEGWRTSSTKVLDNALIGYCKLNGIKPRGT